MINLNESALICDFAETYHIYNYRELPARQAALYACGLRANARIIQQMSGAKAPAETTLLAIIADALRTLVWQNTKDGHSGKNPPKSILRMILGDDENKVETGSFSTVDDFKQWREQMLGVNHA